MEKNLKYYFQETLALIRVSFIKINLWLRATPANLCMAWSDIQRKATNLRSQLIIPRRKKQPGINLLEYFDGWELLQLALYWDEVRCKLERQNAERGVTSDYVSHPRLCAEYFRPGGKLFESYKIVLEKLLQSEPVIYLVYQELQVLREERQRSMLRLGGYLVTQAGNKRRDLPWTLVRGSDAWKRAVKRQPRLTRLNKKIRAKEVEYQALMKETEIDSFLHILTATLGGRAYRSCRKPRSLISLIMGDDVIARGLRAVGLLS